MNTQEIFSYNLKKIREARGETRQDFAKLIDISANNLAKIENQERFTSAPMVDKICINLNILPEELFKVLTEDDDNCKTTESIINMIKVIPKKELNIIKNIIQAILKSISYKN